MTDKKNQPAAKTRISWSWLRMALSLREKVKLGDKQVIFIWAVVVGALGALTALVFEMGVELVQDVLTGRTSYKQIQVFQEMASQDWAWCIFVPAAGGLLARPHPSLHPPLCPGQGHGIHGSRGAGQRLCAAQAQPCCASLSAVFSVGSGASIGREGPLVQAAAVVGSALGRFFHLSAPRLRLVVACAAASGMSSAFHTPLAGGLFVSEIVLGALTIDFLAPLLVASCAGYFTMGLFHEPAPIYQLQQEVSLTGNQHVLWCVLLGALASLVASFWLLILKKSRQYLNGKRQWLPVRLMAAGMLVGVIAIFYPEIVGNGKNIITSLIHYEFDATRAGILLFLKIFTVAIVFGVGTVGGALTPSLTIGSVCGFLFSAALTQLREFRGTMPSPIPWWAWPPSSPRRPTPPSPPWCW